VAHRAAPAQRPCAGKRKDSPIRPFRQSRSDCDLACADDQSPAGASQRGFVFEYFVADGGNRILSGTDEGRSRGFVAHRAAPAQRPCAGKRKASPIRPFKQSRSDCDLACADDQSPAGASRRGFVFEYFAADGGNRIRSGTDEGRSRGFAAHRAAPA